ncbi:MAG: hypothetical protein ACE5IR_24545, partial [bacterium]
MPKENIVKYKGERRDLAFKVLPGPQTLAMRSDVDVLEFGGARGGSKTHTLIYKAQVRMHKEGFKGLIARRTYKQLGDIMQRCQELYPKLGYQWEAAPEKHWWINPKTGSFIKLLSFQHEKNVDDVLGHEYQFIGIDQAEGFTQKMLEKLRMCTRTTNPDIPPRAFYTTNPGGVSHLYHKREFVDACQPIPDGMKKYNERYEVYWQPMRPGPVRKDKYGVLRHYIPALVFENPYLLENDPIYVGTLLSMPEPLRSAMLYGDWSVYEGMFFGEWNKQIHVVPGFPIPLTWPRYVSVDYGTKHPFVLLWHAIDPSDGCVYTYREYVQPDKALRFHATMFHALNNQEEIDRVICPHDMWMRIDRDPEST